MSDTQSPPVLRMDGISKSFGAVQAIRSAKLEALGGQAVALMGANGAGKSTLMNVLGGVVVADSGTISIDGVDVQLRTPREAAQHGIAFVHQELMMFPSMSVAENIFIDDLPTSRLLIDKREMAQASAELLGRLGSTISPDTPVEALSVGDRQLVEIARALRQRARVMIFDEPTSSLTGPERERLFAVIRGLKADGVIIIYVTHFLDEIFAICEQVYIMRNGETVWASPIEEVDPAKVVHLMLGVTEDRGRVRPPAVGDATLVSVHGLAREGVLEDVNFEIRRGEIVGLWGLLGSGRTELMRALIGLDPIDRGAIRWLAETGTMEQIRPQDLRQVSGIVTEDRRGEGIHLPLSVAENIALPNLASLLNRWRLIDGDRQRALADRMIERLNIKVSGREQTVATLSGGNQQKVVFARWLANRPKLFLLDEPTRGLDVSAKAEILKLVVELAESGVSFLLVSSELEELMRVSDRYLIIRRGRIDAELPGSATSDDLMRSIADISVQRKVA